MMSYLPCRDIEARLTASELLQHAFVLDVN